MKGENSRKSTSSTTTTTSKTKKETKISSSRGRGLDPHLLRTEKGNKPLVERLGLALAWVVDGAISVLHHKKLSSLARGKRGCGPLRMSRKG
jgi:hypothetical protein